MRIFNLRSFLFWAAKDTQTDIQHANFQLASLPFLGRQRKSETYTICEFSNCMIALFGASKTLQKRNNMRLFNLWSCLFWSCIRHSSQYKTCNFSNCILALFGQSKTLKKSNNMWYEGHFRSIYSGTVLHRKIHTCTYAQPGCMIYKSPG